MRSRGWDPHEGINVLIRKGTLIRASLLRERGFSLFRTHIPRKGHMNTRREGSCLKARKETLARNQICQHLDLGLPSLQNCEKHFLFKLLSLYFPHSSPKDLLHTYTDDRTWIDVSFKKASTTDILIHYHNPFVHSVPSTMCDTEEAFC